MPRKIPKSNKQKRLKPVDPFNFKAQREKNQKSQINLPPKTFEQEIPRSFREIFMRPKDENEMNAKKRKLESNNEEFVKRKWESERQYLRRIQRETADFVSEELHKIKFDLVGVDVDADNKKEVKEKLNRKEKKLLNERKKSKGKLHDTPSVSSSTRKNKRKRRKNDVDLLNQKEVVEFGERVDEPPRLTVAPKKRKVDASSSSAKAGGRDLLLKNILQKTEETVLSPVPIKSSYVNDGTIKCANREKEKMLIDERNRVIEAYRRSKLLRNR